MLSKQQLIHIATDAVLISLLFLYVNSKTKAVADAMDDLREYTEDQIESINNKLDSIISHMSKQQQQQQYQQVQQYAQAKRQPTQVPQQKSQQVPQKVQQQRQQPTQVPQKVQQQRPQQQVQPEMPKFRATAQVSKQVRFNGMPDIAHIDEFVNSIPSSFAFISATSSPIIPQQKSVPASNIEVIEEEENMPEEDISNDTINELDENDIEEINNALGEDTEETDDVKNE